MKPETLALIIDKPLNANAKAFLAGMAKGGSLIEWENPVVQAHLLGQACHESLAFTYDREIWGPSAAQKRYENRADLGHSSAVAGEAFMFRGKGPFQITGRDNHRAFYRWCLANRVMLDAIAPDFEAEPDKLLTDPWEGISVVWYWHTRKLTALAKQNDFENITKRINGGYNGLADRMRWFGRAALGILGRKPNSLVAYQRERNLLPDGIAGTNTRAALFKDLSALVTVTPTDVVKQTTDVEWRKSVSEQLEALNRRVALLEQPVKLEG